MKNKLKVASKVGRYIERAILNKIIEEGLNFALGMIKQKMLSYMRVSTETSTRSTYTAFTGYIYSLSPSTFKNTSHIVNTRKYNNIVTIFPGKYIFKYKDVYILCIVNETAVTGDVTTRYARRTVTDIIEIYIAGKGHASAKDILMKEFITYVRNNELLSEITTIHKFTGYDDMTDIEIPSKTMESIVCKKKDIIINHINNWVAKRDRLVKYGIISKTNILLYGKAGTGKTSIARAIAAMFNAHIFCISLESLINIPSRKIADNDNDEIPMIILIEDIDLLVIDPSADIGASDKAMQLRELQALFQLLDGVESCPNSIIIATTNHIEKLDENMIRDGRFDLKLEIEEFDESDALEMCKLFELSESKTADILSRVTYPIKPSTLQNKIIEIS